MFTPRRLLQSCKAPSLHVVDRPKTLRYIYKSSPISYSEAGILQEKCVREHLDYKAKPIVCQPPPPPPPPPTLLAFGSMNPVYTCGRRDRGKLSDAEIEHLKCGGEAEFVETFRGGQTTFHGPGQLVAYPILDLKSFGLSVRCYVNLLETALINTLDVYGIKGFRTNDTGVWVSESLKIAAIGIHVRRNVTSHGIALNINTDPWWFDRIVACGLPDKKTTTMSIAIGKKLHEKEVATTFANQLTKCLGIDSSGIL